jgi:predicted transcriptional regulator
MVVFSLRIDEKTLKKLRKRAKQEEKTTGKLIRLAIAQFLIINGEKDD